MAAAEVRAAWQRTANRCFVQEDAKRAPKLACCPSAPSSSQQVDAGPPSTADGQDSSTIGFMPLHRSTSYYNLPPDSRWWLQLQPNYGYQRVLTNEQLNILEAERETFRAGVASSSSKLSGAQQGNEVDGTYFNDNINAEPSFGAQSMISATCVKKDPEVIKQELKAVYSKNAQEPLKVKEVKESFELMEVDSGDCAVSKQLYELCFDSGYPSTGGVKTEPWWRTADRDELASLVAQRSLDFIENCDLPQPHISYIKRDRYAHLDCFDCDGILPSSIDWKVQNGLSSPTVHTPGNLTSGSARAEQWVSVQGQSHYGSNKRIRSGDVTTHQGITDAQASESNFGKAQLLEALCHSQTRAREAEKAAKQAYAEKEHIIKLFFRQASHLFAYKQWFRLLQLENLYFQIKNNNQPISTIFPVALPCLPYKTSKLRKSWHKAAKGKQGKRRRPRYDIAKLAIAFALGLSLVGAGLLLGWTVGWMLPAF